MPYQGILAHVLHCCGTVFRNLNTTTTLSESPSTPYTPSHTHLSFAGCCDLIAEIALTLNKEKMNIQEAKQLVVSFQNNKELLVSSNKSFVRLRVRHFCMASRAILQERLPSLLYRLTDTPFHPTSYVQFTYPKPQTNCDTADLISIPSTLNITNFTANGISSTMWLCVMKCSFPVVVHIVSYPIDEHCFLQMWACCFTGNIIIRYHGIVSVF